MGGGGGGVRFEGLETLRHATSHAQISNSSASCQHNVRYSNRIEQVSIILLQLEFAQGSMELNPLLSISIGSPGVPPDYLTAN